MLTPIGTIGWFAMLVIGPIRRQQYGEILIPVIFGMAIIDAWAVAPSALRQEHSSRLEMQLWAAALFPYVVILYWAGKAVFGSREAPKNDLK
ncbi:MAG: hypothetical protein ACKVY0_02985 [Prosthecobacter sp.]